MQRVPQLSPDKVFDDLTVINSPKMSNCVSTFVWISQYCVIETSWYPDIRLTMHYLVFLFTSLFLLDVRSLAVASRSRQSEKQPIVDELALIEHAHIWEGVSVREEQWRRVTDKVITIEQAYAVTTIQA